MPSERRARTTEAIRIIGARDWMLGITTWPGDVDSFIDAASTVALSWYSPVQ